MPKWTPDQQTAIDDRGGALLVSAAAGSGKTAVLTERVLRRLTDENDPVDIDHLLLVTFTNAAAAEMRERIGAALGAAVAANPRDTRLRRQLFLVHRAKITTVHALCLSLWQQAAQGTLIELVDFLVQLSHSLLCFGKFLIAVVCCSGLLLIPNGFELLNKLVLIFKDIFAYCLNCLQDCRFQNRCFYIVRNTFAALAPIIAALESGI